MLHICASFLGASQVGWAKEQGHDVMRVYAKGPDGQSNVSGHFYNDPLRLLLWTDLEIFLLNGQNKKYSDWSLWSPVLQDVTSK